PKRPAPQNLPYRRTGTPAYRLRRRRARHRNHPRNQPRQRNYAKHNEKRTPSETRNQSSAEQNPDCRSQSGAGHGGSILQSPPIVGQVARQDRPKARPWRRLSDAEQHAHEQQHGEAMHESGQRSRERPEGKASGKNPSRMKAVREPSRHDLKRRIRPEERRKQNPKLGRAQPKLVLDDRRRDRQISAIDVAN